MDGRTVESRRIRKARIKELTLENKTLRAENRQLAIDLDDAIFKLKWTNDKLIEVQLDNQRLKMLLIETEERRADAR